jgi:signal transduction histidine kinase
VTTRFIPGSIVTLLAIFLLFIVLRNYLQPIQLMKNRIILLKKGDLDSNIPIISEDELADLSNEMNKMIKEIKDLLTRKQQLLSEVSHELLSPLARIRLLTEMLPDHKNKNRLANEVIFLKGMVTNLLMSDRLSGPYANLDLANIKIEDIIDKSIAMFPDSESKITVLGDVPKLLLNIDITKISLALRNLIENAIKYGDEKKKIEIKVKLFSEKWIDIFVKNYGKGISKENIDKITIPFFRIKDQNITKKSGFGMGLSITKKIIDAHNGALLIHSEIDKYTQFIIRLPIQE